MPLIGARCPRSQQWAGHGLLWVPRVRGPGSLLCFVNSSPGPDAWFFPTSGKISPALTGRKPAFAGSLLCARAGAAQGTRSLGFPEACSDTTPKGAFSICPAPGAPNTCDVFRASLRSGPSHPVFSLCHRSLLLPKGLLGCERTG